MIDTHRSAGTLLPFARRWHVIHEIDLVPFVAWHERLRRLCDRLEACADALPDWPAPREMDELCRGLRDVIERETARDGAFIAELFGRDLRDRLAAALLRRVDTSQTADLIYAEDLIAALEAGPPVGGRAATETLGYMLRGFFVSRRQMLAFEGLAILALGHNRLTADSRTLLVDSLCRQIA